MIREAVLRRVMELHEAPQGADPDPVEKGDPERELERQAEPRDNPPVRDDDEQPPEVPQDEPEQEPESGKEAEQGKEDAIDPAGDAGTESSGQVNRDIEGKSIQSITREDESKILPGAKEVVLTFAQSTEPLRILVTATGRIAFFWRNQMFDVP